MLNGICHMCKAWHSFINLTRADILLNVFLAIAVDNLGEAHQLSQRNRQLPVVAGSAHMVKTNGEVKINIIVEEAMMVDTSAAAIAGDMNVVVPPCDCVDVIGVEPALMEDEISLQRPTSSSVNAVGATDEMKCCHRKRPWSQAKYACQIIRYNH